MPWASTEEWNYDYNADETWEEWQPMEYDDWEPVENDYDATYEDYKGSKNKGKQGKGKSGGKESPGTQCTKCGSRWHSDSQCPMSSADHKTHQAGDPHEGDESADWPYDDEEPGTAEDYWGKGTYRKGKGKSKKGKGKRATLKRAEFAWWHRTRKGQ